MLISLDREEDRKTARDVLEILDVAVREYIHTNDAEIAIHISRLQSFYDELLSKIETGDYSKDDERRRRVDALLKLHDKN